MSFLATIVKDAAYYNVQKENNSFRLSSQIGYDDKNKHIFYLVIYMDIPPGWGYELRYCVEEYDENSSEFQIYWDRNEVCKFIGSEDRQKILALLLALVQHLICLAKPDSVAMNVEDKGIGPPRKDVLIAEVFECCGYTVETCDPYYGRRVFHMKRSQNS